MKLALCCFTLVLPHGVLAQDVAYTLGAGSTLTVDEPGEGVVLLNLSGGFVLAMAQGAREVSGLLTEIVLDAASSPPRRLTGSGTLLVLAPPGSPRCLPAALGVDLLLVTEEQEEVFFTTELALTETFPALDLHLFQLGGDPRFVEMRIAASPDPAGPLRFFTRGNSNGDSVTNISDAIHVLMHLFSGGDPIACEDAADVNDDGKMDVSDAVALLRWLFLGLSGPPLPHCFCGTDSAAADGLGCLEGGCL